MNEDLVPQSLLIEYWDDPLVNQCFDYARHVGDSSEQALINCVRALVKQKGKLLDEVKTLAGVRTMLSVTNESNYIPRLEILKKQVGL